MSPKITLFEDDITLIENLAAKGFGLRGISKRLGINHETLRQRRKENPAVEEALQRGRAVEEKILVDSLLARALDPKNNAGAAAAMFLLKTRHHYRENAEVDTGSRVAVVVNIPGALKPEDYARLIQVHPEALASAKEKQK